MEKICNKCKLQKPIDDFYLRCDSPDKHSYCCKQCQKERDKKRDFKAMNEHAKIWRKTPAGKLSLGNISKRYNARHPEKTKKRNRVYREKYPEREKAHANLRQAIRVGKIPKVNTLPCKHCGNQAVDYHHWHGYDEAHQLDVIPLCRSCHKIADK